MTEDRKRQLADWRAIVGLVQRGKMRQALAAYDTAINAAQARGYGEGHEDQMRMRIRDAQERREKGGRA